VEPETAEGCFFQMQRILYADEFFEQIYEVTQQAEEKLA
jgi:hypothetical protein